MNGTEQMGQEITVNLHTPKAERHEQIIKQSVAPDQPYTNLFVKNIPSTYTLVDLRNLFEPYGPIDHMKVEAEKNHAFINFKNHEDAKRAVEDYDGKKVIEGKTLIVTRHIRKDQLSGVLQQQYRERFNCNIFILNIPKTVTEVQFRKKMEQVGEVQSVRLIDHVFKEGNQSFSQKGYVNFKDVKTAQRCI